MRRRKSWAGNEEGEVNVQLSLESLDEHERWYTGKCKG